MDNSRRTVVLATSNPGKLREIQAVLADLPLHVMGLGELPPVAPPVEDGATFADNARAKALYYAGATGYWCLADDSGLLVDALAGRPGVHSARYAADDDIAPDAGPHARDAANNGKLLRELADVTDEKRTARFVCHLSLADGQGILLEATGIVAGRIGRTPRGDNGFGYDPLFLISELGQTAAELEPERKNAVSHRGQATRRMRKLLADLLAKTP